MNEEPAAFELFVQDSSVRLLHVAELLCGDRHRAEDLLQIAYSRLYPRWSRVDDPYAFTRRVLVNLRNDWWRAHRQEVVGVPLDRPVADLTPGVDRRLVVLGALAQLTRRERSVLVLRYYEDLTEAAVAQELGLALGTVKSTAARAIGRLRTDGLLDELAPAFLGDNRA